MLACAILTLSFFPKSVLAQDPGTVAAEICNAGACAPVDPLTALAIMGVVALGDELNKGDKAFGPNGFVVKTVNSVLNDLHNGGLGPNNDLVKAFENIKNDITKGPGPNNDIVKFFRNLSIKI